jgi:Right handed beta helix region
MTLALLIVLLWIALGEAATYYVSPTGSESASCAQAQHSQTPRRTINSGIACLAAGDTLVIGAGTYDELLADYAGERHATGATVRIPSGTSWTQPVTLRGERPGAVTITSSVTNHNCGSMVCLQGVQYVIFADLILDAAFTNENVVGFGGPSSEPAHLRFQQVEVRYALGQGFQGGTHHTEFLHLDVHHNGMTPDGQTTCGKNTNFCYQDAPLYARQLCHGFCHGIYVHGDGLLIDGGTWHHNDAWGIHLYPGVTNSIVRNARACHNADVGIGLIIGSSNQVLHNVVEHNSTGIWIKTSGTSVMHNTLYGNRTQGLLLDAEGLTVQNNLEGTGGTCASPLPPAPRNLRVAVP